MPQFSDAQITKWANDYEREICAKHNLVVDRLSIALAAGQGEFELPNYVTNIRAMLYKGKELYPKGFRQSVIIGDNPNPSGSTPIEYLFSGKGMRVIKLMPAPIEALVEYAGDVWTPEAEAVSLIVEFYRTPDFSDPFKRLPPWCRRYILKDYVCNKAFIAGGPGQDIRAANYYEGRMVANEEYVKQIRSNLYENNVNVPSPYPERSGRPGRPVLPDNFPVR
jgi:hypothetical protein